MCLQALHAVLDIPIGTQRIYARSLRSNIVLDLVRQTSRRPRTYLDHGQRCPGYLRISLPQTVGSLPRAPAGWQLLKMDPLSALS